MAEHALSVRGIEKSFGRNSVLRGIDLDLAAGQVSVLMGANGAGKSTLVKLICGVEAADAGQMTLAGESYAPPSAAAAIQRGVVTVHQSIDDGVIPDLDMATNLMLDRLTQKRAPLFVRERQMRAAARDIAQSMGLDWDVRTRVGDLGVADRQMIAIARAMARAPTVLILDEPTSSLSSAEADRLFALIDRLRAQGVAILYISHRMSDIRRLADRIICLRDGQISGVFEGAALDYEAAVTAMLGHRMTDVDVDPVAEGTPVLQIEGVRVFDTAAPLSLTAHQGEVIALTGLLGSGKSRLADIIFGRARAQSGSMRLDGKTYAPRRPSDAIAERVFLSPKDRGSNAVIRAFDITNNMSLPFLGAFSQLSLINGSRQRAAVARMIDDIGVVCQSGRDSIVSLSGGNQQKVMIARWLMAPARVLLLDEPFQGVDIGARRDIGRHIRTTAGSRTTLVFVAEIDEALEIADRIVVMHEGTISGEHRNSDVDLARLVAQITGEAA